LALAAFFAECLLARDGWAFVFFVLVFIVVPVRCSWLERRMSPRVRNVSYELSCETPSEF